MEDYDIQAESLKVSSLLRQAKELFIKNNAEKSLNLLNEALKIARANKDILGTGNVHKQRGFHRALNGPIYEALYDYSDALSLFRQGNYRIHEAYLLMSLGYLYESIDKSVTKKYFEQAASIFQALGMKSEEHFAHSMTIEQEERQARIDIRLCHAARLGDLERTKSLLESEPDLVNIKDDEGFLPLHWAARFNQLDVAEFLLQHGAEVDSRESHEMTSLHIAASSLSEEVAELLIKYGANLNALDNNGDSVLDFAISANFNQEGIFATIPPLYYSLSEKGAKHGKKWSRNV